MSFTSVAVEAVQVGSRLKLFAVDGIFEGVVHTVDRVRHVLTLKNGIWAHDYFI
jgi:hypothetical protein